MRLDQFDAREHSNFQRQRARSRSYRIVLRPCDLRFSEHAQRFRCLRNQFLRTHNVAKPFLVVPATSTGWHPPPIGEMATRNRRQIWVQGSAIASKGRNSSSNRRGGGRRRQRQRRLYCGNGQRISSLAVHQAGYRHRLALGASRK